jgi:hypothetical protein
MAMPHDAVTSTAPPPLTLLFAGSSSTYFYDLPDAVAGAVSGCIAEHEGREAIAKLVGRSGSDIRVYADPAFQDYEYGVRPGQTFLAKVQEERPDYVVLQTVTRFIMGDDDPTGSGTAHAAAIAHYIASARAAGSEPVLYEMGWDSGERHRFGRERILALAQNCRIRRFVPCATAWARVRSEKPDFPLLHPNDSWHPGDYGHFLNLACFYAAFTRKSPEGQLPRTFGVWSHWNKEEKAAHRAEVEAALATYTPRPYHAELPSWMREAAAYGATCTIDDTTAHYLEKVAWEEWQRIDRILCTANPA